MEAGTYLTEVDCNKRCPSALKFRRCDTNKNRFADPQQIKIVKKTRFSSLNRGLGQLELLDEYYDSKEIRPGTPIYRIVLEGEERREHDRRVPLLELNLPETMVMNDSGYSLIHSHNGLVKVTHNFTYPSFSKLVRGGSPENKAPFPAVITAEQCVQKVNYSVFLSNELDTRIIPKNENQACIRFIQPHTKHPNVLRLRYVPKCIRNSKPNIAFKIVNKRMIDQELLSRKFKQIHHYIASDNGKQESVNVIVVKGKALKEVEAMAQSLINYVEYVKSVKITELVVDFTFSHHKIYEFHQIKSVRSCSLSGVWEVGTPEQIIEAAKDKNNQISCKLCGFYFPRDQITRTVTHNFIFQLLSHLKLRGENVSFFCSVKSTDRSSSCHVCDMCYKLALAEHHLMEVESQFCEKLNICSGPRLEKPKPLAIDYSTEATRTPQNTEEELYEWRIFFYLENLKKLPVEVEEAEQINIHMSFRGFRQSFHKQMPRREAKALLEDSWKRKRKSTFKSCHKASKANELTQSTYRVNDLTNRSQDCLRSLVIQKVKLLMVYTDCPDISQILQKEELKVELQFGGSRMKGESSTFRKLKKSRSCQQHSCEILLFDSAYKYCSLELNIGLTCNRRVGKTDLDLIECENGLYFPAKPQRNCDPLPEEWMEIINNATAAGHDCADGNISQFQSLSPQSSFWADKQSIATRPQTSFSRSKFSKDRSGCQRSAISEFGIDQLEETL